jgi:hypothetical protein
MRTRERRYFTTEFETRTTCDGQIEIEGHAAVFDRHSQDLGGFVENVAPTAFKRTLSSNPDTRALFNHDPSLILGRTRAGTLDLATDDSGLYYRNRLPDTSYARDLRVSMERGDVTQSSFGFWTIQDSWGRTEAGMPVRTLTEVSLHEGDVSPVTFPAYLDTDSGVRAAVRSLASLVGHDIDPDGIAAALDEIESRSVDSEQHDDDMDDEQTDPATATPLSIIHARALLDLKRHVR